MLAKVCGLTNRADAEFAAEAGADLLGFVSHPPSPRHCPAPREAAGSWADRSVLVMVSDNPEGLARAADASGFRRIQPHAGPEARGRVTRYLRERGFWVLLPWADTPGQEDGAPDCHLWEPGPALTGLPGGSGRTNPLQHPPPGPFLLAGGLHPDNLRERLGALAPLLRPRLHGFDAASRLESRPGLKNPDLVLRFIETIRSMEKEAPHAL
ncbi:MAG: phosphoribosylanthranilate isomerase [Acidobacteria bacterium]|nr:phosphoribosylanthranilate isomerase [Acidobacteriota bacterium]